MPELFIVVAWWVVFLLAAEAWWVVFLLAADKGKRRLNEGEQQ